MIKNDYGADVPKKRIISCYSYRATYASVLGEVGDVLILANSEDRLFYFVCRSAIGFIG